MTLFSPVPLANIYDYNSTTKYMQQNPSKFCMIKKNSLILALHSKEFYHSNMIEQSMINYSSQM